MNLLPMFFDFRWLNRKTYLHLTASLLYQAGEPVAVIQAILRHKSPNTTERYLHRMFGNDRSREALEKLHGPAEVVTLPQKKTG